MGNVKSHIGHIVANLWYPYGALWHRQPYELMDFV